MTVEISERVWTALEERRARTGEAHSTIVESALTTTLGLEEHTLFQVSTSNALVQGVFAGAITVAELKKHGDFGLGTFAGLDGELVMIDGECFRATGGGTVTSVDDGQEVPFALITSFLPDVEFEVGAISRMATLHEQLDRERPSQNVFVAVKIDGRFDLLTMRAACPARHGEGLLEATAHQSEFVGTEVEGTLLGFWAPDYTRAISVPGYHFHFISSDRTLGGHVLDITAGALRGEMQVESDVHLAIPDTEEYLAADLGGDHREALAKAETGVNRNGDPSGHTTD